MSASGKVGDPFDPETFQGPQISQRQFDRIMDYIKIGKEEGATCLLGGNRVGDTGYFIEPTIFTGNVYMQTSKLRKTKVHFLQMLLPI